MTRIRIPTVVMVVLAYWVLVVAFQSVQGARAEPFGGYPDEPAHYMSGLMVRDYVAAAFPAPPLVYATDYYTHMPYLAIGYWPPMFYVLEGLWMLAFGWQHSTVLLLIALIAAAVAATCFHVLAARVGFLAAFLSGLLVLLTPAFQWSDCRIMTDTMLALVCLWFCLAFAKWVDHPSKATAVVSGLLLVAALFTKITSIDLALTVFLFLLVTNRWSLLRRKSFWLIPGIVVLCWLPWIVRTRQLVGIGYEGLLHANVQAVLISLCAALWQNLSWLVVLIAVGIAQIRIRDRADSRLLICALLPLSYAIFLLFGSGITVENRFLTLMLAPCAILAGVGLNWLAGKLGSTRRPTRVIVPTLAAVCVAAYTATVGFAWHTPTVDTVSSVVVFLNSQGHSSASSILVPTVAEGSFIAQFAMNAPHRPQSLLIRPTKLLASETWTGASYKTKFSSETDLIALLDRFPIRYIILGTGKASLEYPHDALLGLAVRTHPERWKRLEMPSVAWEVYERSDGRHLPAPAMYALARDALSQRINSVLQ